MCSDDGGGVLKMSHESSTGGVIAERKVRTLVALLLVVGAFSLPSCQSEEPSGEALPTTTIPAAEPSASPLPPAAERIDPASVFEGIESVELVAVSKRVEEQGRASVTAGLPPNSNIQGHFDIAIKKVVVGGKAKGVVTSLWLDAQLDPEEIGSYLESILQDSGPVTLHEQNGIEVAHADPEGPAVQNAFVVRGSVTVNVVVLKDIANSLTSELIRLNT